MIKTRIFENYDEIVRCSDCNAICWEGMLPKKRLMEGLKMNQWQCFRRGCGFFNSIEMSLACKSCGAARPRNTLPQDLLFPLYVPMNISGELDRYTQVFERLLTMIPLAESSVPLPTLLTKMKNNQHKLSVKDENIIDDYNRIRQEHIYKVKREHFRLDDDDEARAKFESAAEDKFCEMLSERIMVNIEKRNAHQAMLDQN